VNIAYEDSPKALRSTKTHKETSWGRLEYHEPETKDRSDLVSGQIIGAAIEVHRQLGAGLLESVYRACLAHELELRGIAHRQEVPISFSYKGSPMSLGHRLDRLVEDLVIVELKSVERLEPIHEFQLLTYLRLSGRWLGLLINFNTYRVRDGLRRMLNLY
jgi:GxxExxY protein